MLDAEIFLLFSTGIIGGFLAGFLGIGGGILYVVILPTFLSEYDLQGVELIRFVIANSIFCTLIASISGNIAQITQRRFYTREVLLVGITGIFASLLALNLVVFKDWYSQSVFNVILLVLLCIILVQTLRRSSRKFRFVREVEFDRRKFILAGFMGGVIAATSGLGGGAIVVPLLNVGLKMNIKKAKSVSLGVIFLTSMAITVYNLLSNPDQLVGPGIGYILFPLVIPIAIGVLISTPFGVRMSRKSPAFLISYIFAIFTGLVIIKKLVETYEALL